MLKNLAATLLPPTASTWNTSQQNLRGEVDIVTKARIGGESLPPCKVAVRYPVSASVWNALTDRRTYQ